MQPPITLGALISWPVDVVSFWHANHCQLRYLLLDEISSLSYLMPISLGVSLFAFCDVIIVLLIRVYDMREG